MGNNVWDETPAKLFVAEDTVTKGALYKLLTDAHAPASGYSAHATIYASPEEDVQVSSLLNGVRRAPLSGLYGFNRDFNKNYLWGDTQEDLFYVDKNGKVLGFDKVRERHGLDAKMIPQIASSYYDPNGHSMLRTAGTIQDVQTKAQLEKYTIESVSDSTGHKWQAVQMSTLSSTNHEAAANLYVLKAGRPPSNLDDILKLSANDVVGVVHSDSHENGDRARIDVQIQGPSKPVFPPLKQSSSGWNAFLEWLK
jgi:hypothetical protein